MGVSTIAIIGCGTMGEHPERASQHGVCLSPQCLYVTTRRKERAAALAEKYGVHASVDNEKAVREASLVVSALSHKWHWMY